MRCLLILLSLLLAPCSLLAKPKAQTPNILFILLDDFGWKDTSYMGSDFYETPHLDKLAAEGLIFTNAYSAAANCAPARACLLTGQYTPRHEVFNVGTTARGKSKHRKLLHIPGRADLADGTLTWGNTLQSAGYTTGTFGKWHATEDPLQFGFDHNIGGTHAGSPPKGYYPPHPNAPGLEDAPNGEWLTDTITNKTIEFIDENANSSWAAYFTLFNVHTPIQPKKDLLPKYAAKEPGQLHNNIKMATMIQSVDDNVGRLVAHLEATNQRENTIIFLFSDNGGYGPATDMDPLYGYKGTYYEGGIRVPFFANWPGRIPAGETDTPIIGVDIYPTLADIAGAELPSPNQHPLDGESLLPLFLGEVNDLGDRPLLWHFPAYLQSYSGKYEIEQSDPHFRSRPCSVIRVGNFKLHHYFEDDRIELYNLSKDIGEQNNLADSRPEKAQELLKQLSSWRTAINASIPSELNPEYAP